MNFHESKLLFLFFISELDESSFGTDQLLWMSLMLFLCDVFLNWKIGLAESFVIVSTSMDVSIDLIIFGKF